MDKTSEHLAIFVTASLNEIKGQDIVVIDLTKQTDFTDAFVLVTATSRRHAQALSDRLVENIKRTGIRILGIEGKSDGTWILIDLGQVLVHIMQTETRRIYNIEGLWESRNQNLEKEKIPPKTLKTEDTNWHRTTT